VVGNFPVSRLYDRSLSGVGHTQQRGNTGKSTMRCMTGATRAQGGERGILKAQHLCSL